MLRPAGRWIFWLGLAAWFAAGVGGLTTRSERLTYAQTRALARLSFDLSPDRRLFDEPGDGPLALRERPGASLVALPFYALGQLIGARVGDDPADPVGLTAQITGLAAAAATATALMLLGICALRLGSRPGAAAAAVLVLALASPLTAWGSRLAPPAFGLLAVALAVWPWLLFRENDDRVLLRLSLGAGLGLMFLLDDAMLLLAPALLIWTLAQAKQVFGRPTYALAFLAPFLGGVLTFLAVNATAWGGPFAAPDGLPLHLHFWREYYFYAATNENFLTRRLYPGLMFWLFNDGPAPERLALARDIPAALRGQIFYGVFTWFPVLAAGWLGATAARREDLPRLPMRLLGLAFWLAVGLYAAAYHFAGPDRRDAAGLLPFCFAPFVGLGYFFEYHLLAMRGVFWKYALRLAFLGALAVSLANGWMEAAAPPRTAPSAARPPYALTSWFGLPAPEPPPRAGIPAGPLPASMRDAFFLDTDRLANWLRRDWTGFASALRPGLNNLVLFAPLLWLLALIPGLAGLTLGRLGGRPPSRPPSPPAPPPAPAAPDEGKVFTFADDEKGFRRVDLNFSCRRGL